MQVSAACANVGTCEQLSMSLLVYFRCNCLSLYRYKMRSDGVYLLLMKGVIASRDALQHELEIITEELVKCTDEKKMVSTAVLTCIKCLMHTCTFLHIYTVSVLFRICVLFAHSL